jgi:hypothetical protein
MTLVLKPRIGPPLWMHPIQGARTMSNHAFFDTNTHTTKSTRLPGVKELEPISIFWPITSQDFRASYTTNWLGL